jgi:amino acid adenylation domain-containing protein
MMAPDVMPDSAGAVSSTAPPMWLCESDRELCLHQIIENWARRTPGGLAVRYEQETLTYSELDTHANQLAWTLRHRGIGVGSLVGVSMKRGLDMIIGVLAILKAGAAYIPLDPRMPRERLLFMVADAPLPVILTSGTQLDAGQAVAIDLRTERPDKPSRQDRGGLDVQVIPGDLVYTIYTSGSTGQPKGVMVPHRGVVNWLVWMRNTFEVTPADVVLKKAPLTFDVSAWELFLPLISGACLVLADSDRQFDPTYLARLMATTRVSIAQFVPSLMRSFLELPDLPDLSALRHVMCGGEVLPPKLLKVFLDRLTSEVCNSYGPTEASIGVTRYPCSRDDDGESVPIGSAIDNTELYILDEDLNPVAPGLPGELYIGGRCLGRGYLNRPDLTAERFLPNPFNPEGEARMYRTGDLCRFLDNGAIDFLGRIDDQVKVRGVRIELGEVEKAFAANEAVEACAAAAERDDNDEAFLVAYVTLASNAHLSEADLRHFVRQKLPQSMVPSEIVFVASFPLSPNGKIDRKRLTDLRPTVAKPKPRHVVLPENIEGRVAALWERTLHQAPRSNAEDFFDCGGDSLSATQLLILIENEFSVRVPLEKVLDVFTIRAIAGLLRSGGEAPRTPLVVFDVSPGMAPGSAVPASAWAAPQGPLCRFATMDDVPGIHEVCRRAFPAYAQASLEAFRELCAHRWERNPARTDDDPFGWLLEAPSGQIIGFHGLVPTRLWVGGRTLHAVSPTTWAVDPGTGRAGLTMLARYTQWGANRFLLNTTANAVTSRMHESSDFGMRRIPLADFDKRLVWVLDIGTLMRWKLEQREKSALLRGLAGLPAIAGVADLAVRAMMRVSGSTPPVSGHRRIRFACAPLPVNVMQHFGDEFDELWDRLKDGYEITTERSAAFLNWRHVGIPALLGRTHVLACRDGGRLLGYVSLREPATTAPGHVVATDLFYDRERRDAFYNLMNAAFAFALSRSASTFEVFGLHPSVIAELETQGPYVLRRRQLERLAREVSVRNVVAALRRRDEVSTSYWWRAPDPELARFCSSAEWWPSGIDGDLNL